jgi:hypothetical protein
VLIVQFCVTDADTAIVVAAEAASAIAGAASKAVTTNLDKTEFFNMSLLLNVKHSQSN